MALGPGKYDVLCSYVRAQARARGAIVIIVAGNKGDGFSCQASAETTAALPDMLDHISKQIRGDIPELDDLIAHTPQQKLRAIASIIEGVENRCMAVDGPVTPTAKEITDDELRRIYEFAKSV